MVAKIGIKLYIVLACINLAVWGYIHHDLVRVSLAFMNIIFLFLVLFQERTVFSNTGSKRVLFSADVFFYIAIAVGLIGASFWYACDTFFSRTHGRLVAFLIGGLFYVLSVRLFGMYQHERVGHVPHIRRLTLLLTGAFVYLLGMILPAGGQVSTLGSVGHRRDSFSSSIQTLGEPQKQDSIVDEDNEPTNVNELLVGIRENNQQLDTDTSIEIEESEESGNDANVGADTSGPVFPLDIIQDLEPGLTFGNFLPELVNTYDLGPAKSDYTFTHISRENDLYPAFAVARDYTMIGTATHPDQPILCKHLMVLLGLAEAWEVDVSTSVFEVYWSEAEKRGYLEAGCLERNTQATFADLP